MSLEALVMAFSNAQVSDLIPTTTSFCKSLSGFIDLRFQTLARKCNKQATLVLMDLFKSPNSYRLDYCLEWISLSSSGNSSDV